MITNELTNDLSGAITLPLFEKMREKLSIAHIKQIYLLLDNLYDSKHRQEMFYLIHMLIAITEIEIPNIYYENIKNSNFREGFAGAVLEDFKDILCEFE